MWRWILKAKTGIGRSCTRQGRKSCDRRNIERNLRVSQNGELVSIAGDRGATSS